MLKNGDLSNALIQTNVHVVLVETIESLNVGSVARAMKNLGFKSLHLVAPRAYNPNKAAITACWAKDLLEQMKIHKSLEEALGPMEEVIGFSAREEAARPGKLLLPDWIKRFEAKIEARTALVFGAEDSGLKPAQIEQCHWIVRIPSAADCPSFNLAQSVLVALYELSRLQWENLPDFDARELPAWNQYQQLDRIVDEVLNGCEFYKNGGPAPIPGLIKNLFRRMDMDEHEMRVMLAMFARINKTLKIRGKNRVEGEIETQERRAADIEK